MKEIESMKVWSNVSISVGILSFMIFDVLGAIPILISCIGILVSFCHKTLFSENKSKKRLSFALTDIT